MQIYFTIYLVIISYTVFRTASGEGGELCDTRQYAKALPNNSGAFLRCEALPNSDTVGTWKIVRCKKGEAFMKVHQACKSQHTIRRQMSMCQVQPTSPVCQEQYCGASNSNPYLGGQCSWTNAGLLPSPSSSSNFMQCTPSSLGSACGTWNQMQCAPGTAYNPVAQVCVMQQSMCGPLTIAVCPCGVANACPPPCTCVSGVCCYPSSGTTAPTLPPFYTTQPPIYPQLPLCPNGQRAMTNCFEDSNCPPDYFCRDGGCCPLPKCPSGQTAMQVCVGSGQANCPSSFLCINGGCCSAPRCPGGELAVQTCSGYGQQCPQGFSCQNGGCCRVLTCPNGQSATQSCYGSGRGSCMPGYTCQNGACCLQPTCPNGQPAIQTCSGYGQSNCPPNYLCQNGACCPLPLPTCPRGQPAFGHCSGINSCPSGQYCFNGGCCPVPQCPQGQMAIQPCDGNYNCPLGYFCQEGGCCPLGLPMCPNSNMMASAQCSGPGTCPSGQYCYVDNQGKRGCCQIPLCSNNVPSVQACTPDQACPVGLICENGACCPPPICPNGQPGVQKCSIGSLCPSGLTCQNGVCCPPILPICPTTGQPAEKPCNSNVDCSFGHSCYNGGCCLNPEPYSTTPEYVMCPSGHLPSQRCGMPSFSCPEGQHCFNGQFCCPSTMYSTPGPVAPCASCCPVLMISLCQCATYNNMCPTGSVCNTGTCCAGPNQASPQIASSSYGPQPYGPQSYGPSRPGDRCQVDSDCPGNPDLASCRLGSCICTGEARSNGVSCVMQKRRYDPKVQCGQFGKDCKFFFKNRRRRPSARELGINNDTVPLWWLPLVQNNNCDTDKECTPDHTCISKKCYPHLKPGDLDCKFDQQCNRTVECSHCAVDESTKRNVCQCDSKKFEFANECWNDCPVGTVRKGRFCFITKVKQSTLKMFAKKLLHMFSPVYDDPKHGD